MGTRFEEVAEAREQAYASGYAKGYRFGYKRGREERQALDALGYISIGAVFMLFICWLCNLV